MILKINQQALIDNLLQIKKHLENEKKLNSLITRDYIFSYIEFIL